MGTRTNKTKLLKAFSAALLAVLLMPTLSFPVLADYIHGYFRYEVTDQSVTITAYTGNEESVTVPSMIGGNPVNTIAAGAFAGRKSVKTVYLPDTVSCVEEGAFDTEQTVFFAAGEPVPAETEPGPETAVGVPTPDGGLITTDDGGNLLWVDSSGNETVLADSGQYIKETEEDGSVTIRDGNGQIVSVDEGVVSFSDGGRTVEVNTLTGVITETDQSNDASFEEAEPDETEAAAGPVPQEPPEETQSAPTEDTSAPETSAQNVPEKIPLTIPLILTGLITAILFFCVIAFSRRRKPGKKKSTRR